VLVRWGGGGGSVCGEVVLGDPGGDAVDVGEGSALAAAFAELEELDLGAFGSGRGEAGLGGAVGAEADDE